MISLCYHPPTMKRCTPPVTTALFIATGLAALLGTSPVSGQAPRDTRDAHIAKARTAAGTDFTYLFERTCGALTPPAPVAGAARPAAAPPGPPPRAQWYAAP